jgi:hypothetical protein
MLAVHLGMSHIANIPMTKHQIRYDRLIIALNDEELERFHKLESHRPRGFLEPETRSLASRSAAERAPRAAP